MLHLIVFSGLCNRLFAIISAMRYARKTQQELTIYWRIPVGRYGMEYKKDEWEIRNDENIKYFFREMPDIILKTWDYKLINKLLKEGNTMIWDGSKIIPEFMERDEKGNLRYDGNFIEMIKKPIKLHFKENVIINMPTSPFGYDGDNINHITRDYIMPCGIPIKKTTYEKELSKFARKLRPIEWIENIIRFYDNKMKMIERINKLPRMGIHIRRTDLKTDVTNEQLDSIIESYMKEYRMKYNIYLCSDDMMIQNKYEEKYALMTYPDETKTYNNFQGTQKALVDLYMLSKCKYIIGTQRSSFSYYSYILSDDDTIYEIHS